MGLLTLSYEPKEEWRDVAGHPGYQVSNLARVRSFVARGSRPNDIRKRGEPLVMNPCLGKVGYYLVSVTGGKRLLAHRMVALAFIPNPENKPQVNHKNGNKADNRIENLEWCTPKENSQHAADVLGVVGERKFTKLKANDVYDIKTLTTFGAGKESLAEVFGVTVSAIKSILNGYSWRHLS